MPRDHRRFAAASELRLYVDGAPRQRSPASAMIWDFDALIDRAWAWQDRRWDHRGTQVSLLPDSEAIPERTLLLSGTPQGTVFAGLQAPHFLSGVAAWLLGGWSERLPSHVLSAYIEDARSSGAYLRPGNLVEIHVDRLGVLRNPIVE